MLSMKRRLQSFRQLDDEQKRTDELNEYKKYIQTKKYVEDVAKDKFGLVYPDEIIFRGKK